jgi:hypothetical protein
VPPEIVGMYRFEEKGQEEIHEKEEHRQVLYFAYRLRVIH